MDEVKVRRAGLEEQRAKEFQAAANLHQEEEKTTMGYGDLNRRVRNEEYNELKPEVLQQKKKEYEVKKASIEKLWVENTTEKVKALKKKGDKSKGSNTDVNYYDSFSLEELEVFLKHSERASNSEEYNDVVTDLEVYNRVKESEGEDANELMTLLRHLTESCNTYLNGKKKWPWSKTGRIRKAIITNLRNRVVLDLKARKDAAKERQKKAYSALTEKQNEGTVTEEVVTGAFKAQMNIVYQVLNGNILLKKEELAQLDTQMVSILKAVKQNVGVDSEQSNTMSSRFFNALGWSSNPPKLVSEEDFRNDGPVMKTSPLKKIMYHSMKDYKKDGKVVLSAKDMAAQLAGVAEKNNRLYYGVGRIGKGVYTAVRSDAKGVKNQEDLDSQEKSKMDKIAANNSWAYGDEEGSTMMQMVLNEHARIIYRDDLVKEVEKASKSGMFKETFEFLRSSEPSTGNCGFEEFLTMTAALFGYNTIRGESGFKGVDYYTTSDRKAFSINSTVEVLNKDKKKDQEVDFLMVDEVKLDDLKKKQ